MIREHAFDGEEKHYIYNENGRLFQIRQPNILTQFDYYADGQIASKSFTHLHTGQKQIEKFDYNLNNQLSRVSNEVSLSPTSKTVTTFKGGDLYMTDYNKDIVSYSYNKSGLDICK
ncbi:rhs family domain protein [Acinetobacter sp. 1566109]|nr:rhs family domain protein [Acinetobacter sp. 1566109]